MRSNSEQVSFVRQKQEAMQKWIREIRQWIWTLESTRVSAAADESISESQRGRAESPRAIRLNQIRASIKWRTTTALLHPAVAIVVDDCGDDARALSASIHDYLAWDERAGPNGERGEPSREDARPEQLMRRLRGLEARALSPVEGPRDAGTKPTGPKRKRKPSLVPQQRPLTEIETKTIEVVARHGVNYAAAAAEMRKDRKTVRENYLRALDKSNRIAGRNSRSVDACRLPEDERGQVNLSKRRG